jgi:DNA-binding response OmpR family regulator
MSTQNIIKNLNILYAEDDIETKDKIASILKIMFAKVYVAKDGKEALELYKKNRVDILMLDYVMPHMSGYDVANAIRELDHIVPIIISSAYTDKDKLLKIIELNNVQFIEKPIVYEELNNSIKKAVEILEENGRIITHIKDNLYYSNIQKTILKKCDDKYESIKLSKKEILLLELLLSKRDQLFTKEIIEDVVFGEEIEQNAMRNLIYRLRKKVDSDFIVTIKDMGYLIQKV